jgi:hypothetical protein
MTSRGSSSGSGQRDRSCPPDDLTRRQRAHHDLTRRQHPTRLQRVQEAQLDRVDVERAASLSICASAAKQVWTAPKPRIAPHGGLFV